MPTSEITVSCDESFYQEISNHTHNKPTASITLEQKPTHTALSSAKFPHFAKWALKLAFELPPATPHKARSTPAVLSTDTRITPVATIGDRQSRIMARSLNTSAASR